MYVCMYTIFVYSVYVYYSCVQVYFYTCVVMFKYVHRFVCV